MLQKSFSFPAPVMTHAEMLLKTTPYSGAANGD